MNAWLLLLHCWIGTFTQVKTLKTPFWIGFVFDSIESPVKRKMCLFVICWPLLLRWPSKMAYTHLSVVLKPETTGMFECFFCYTCWVIECLKGHADRRSSSSQTRTHWRWSGASWGVWLPARLQTDDGAGNDTINILFFFGI